MAAYRGGAMRPNGPSAPWFKLVLLGETAVGKSSLAICYAGAKFHESRDSTIGAAFLSRTVQCLDGTAVRLEIWDTAGQERFRSLAKLYYRGAQAAIVVYDITNKVSFVRAMYWVDELRTKANNPNMVIALAGSKADLADGQRAVDARDARSYADDNGLLFMETSAKTSANVDEIFTAVATRLLPPESSEENQGVDLEAAPPAKVKTPCCRT